MVSQHFSVEYEFTSIADEATAFKKEILNRHKKSPGLNMPYNFLPKKLQLWSYIALMHKRINSSINQLIKNQRCITSPYAAAAASIMASLIVG